jgi:hypothetical protein
MRHRDVHTVDIIEISLPGSILRPGFWLYVWRVETATGRHMYYVGRTGDSSSPNAAPPYRRLGQHLGMVKASNALRSHLSKRNISPESCIRFDFFAYGPIFDKQVDMNAHKPVRDTVAALEKELATTLQESGYDVLNTVRCSKKLDQKLWGSVKEAFAQRFPELSK